MTSWLAHLALHRRIVFTTKYITLSPVRVGSSNGKSLYSPVDLQVIRMTIGGKEIPYIPGSSLKGVLRSTVEMILRSYGMEVCSMGGCSSFSNNGIKRDERLQQAIKAYNDATSIEMREKYKNAIFNILNEYCLACKIFGSNTYASHIIFNDAYPTDDVITGVKTGIAINRRSGAVKQGALYQVEFVNPGSVFRGSIAFHNLPNYAIGLILKIIEEMINKGLVRIGGFKSRGFGQINAEVESIDGILIKNGKIMDIRDVSELEPLDEYDIKITLSRDDVRSTIKQFINGWDLYAKNRSRKI